MNQFWQVCEFEDSSQPFFGRFTVSAVPETWILKLEDGSRICYWPKVNPGLKIRTFKHPNNGEKYAYYKCRILMDGEKYSTYREARDAEMMAQNVSQIEKPCESTMDFDVSEDIDEGNDIEDNGSIDFDVSDVNDDKQFNEVTGNDKAILKKGRFYSKKPMIFEVEDLDDCDDNLPSVANDPKLPEMAGYAALFQSNNSFLTSTVIDELNASHNVEEFFDDFIKTKVSTIQSKFLSFMDEIRKDLNDVKDFVTSASKKRKIRHDLDERSAPVHNKKSPLNEYDEIFETNQNGASNEDEPLNEENDTSNQKNVQHCNVQDLNEPDQNVSFTKMTPERTSSTENLDAPAPIYMNETFVATSADNDVSNVQHLDVNVQNRPLAEGIHKASNQTFVVKSAPKLVLPVTSIDHYKRNEELLDDEVLEAALTDHLAPFDDEDETTYMNRTISTVFTDDFFLNCVSWKAEKERVNVKHGYLLSCWKESYGKSFNPDVDNAKFKKHFRRLKSAKRAAITSKKKRAIRQKKKKNSDDQSS